MHLFIWFVFIDKSKCQAKDKHKISHYLEDDADKIAEVGVGGIEGFIVLRGTDEDNVHDAHASK